jgi:hypothetical protein
MRAQLLEELLIRNDGRGGSKKTSSAVSSYVGMLCAFFENPWLVTGSAFSKCKVRLPRPLQGNYPFGKLRAGP